MLHDLGTAEREHVAVAAVGHNSQPAHRDLTDETLMALIRQVIYRTELDFEERVDVVIYLLLHKSEWTEYAASKALNMSRRKVRRVRDAAVRHGYATVAKGERGSLPLRSTITPDMVTEAIKEMHERGDFGADMSAAVQVDMSAVVQVEDGHVRSGTGDMSAPVHVEAGHVRSGTGDMYRSGTGGRAANSEVCNRDVQPEGDEPLYPRARGSKYIYNSLKEGNGKSTELNPNSEKNIPPLTTTVDGCTPGAREASWSQFHLDGATLTITDKGREFWKGKGLDDDAIDLTLIEADGWLYQRDRATLETLNKKASQHFARVARDKKDRDDRYAKAAGKKGGKVDDRPRKADGTFDNVAYAEQVRLRNEANLRRQDEAQRKNSKRSPADG